MTHDRFPLGFGMLLLVLFLGFYAWQTPVLWRSPLSSSEVARLVSEMNANIDQPDAVRQAFLERVRDWALKDDGKPVMMLNLLRFRERLAPLPPRLDFRGTPEEANAYYEAEVTPLALKRGELPLFGGRVQAQDLLKSGADTAEGWDRVVVMRAPSRRAFLEFMADPAYGPLVPYKESATEIELIPLSADLVVPDLRWVVGGLLLVLFVSVMWCRAARASNRSAP